MREARLPRWLRPVLAAAVIVAVGVFFAFALADNWQQVREQNLTLGWWAVAAVLAFVIAVGISGWLWGRIITVLSRERIGPVESMRVHFRSWLLKYIPGQVGFVVNKVMWARSRGSSRVVALVSVVYENVFLLLGSTVPMLAILLAARPGSSQVTGGVWIALAAVVPLALLTHPAVFRRAVNLVGRRALGGDVPAEYFLSSRTAWRFQLEFLAPRIVNGVGVMVIAVALADAPPASWVPLAAAYALAGAVGILAVFVPSGLGVREAVFVAFATPYLGLEQAIVVALVARVLATLADASLAGILGADAALRRRSTQKESA